MSGPRWPATLVRGAKQATWPMVSTALTGVTNLLVPLTMQVAAGSAATGALALATTPLTLALSVQRGILGQTYQRGIGRASGLRPALLGIAFFATASSAALVLSFGLATTYLLVTVTIPIALYQDAFRFRAMGVLRPRAAAVSDFVWLAVFVLAATVSAGVARVPPQAAVIGSFLAGAVASAALALALWPRATDSRDLPHASVLSLAAEGLFISGLGTLGQPILALVGGLDALGLLRIAQVTITVPNLLLASIQGSVLARLDVTDRPAVLRLARLVTAMLGLVAAVIIAVCAALPASLYARFDLEPRATFLSCVVLLQVGTALGGYVTVMLWRTRLTAPVWQWLGARVVASSLELAVMVALGVAIGAAGVATGTLVNNAVVGLYVHHHDRRQWRAAARLAPTPDNAPPAMPEHGVGRDERTHEGGGPARPGPAAHPAPPAAWGVQPFHPDGAVLRAAGGASTTLAERRSGPRVRLDGEGVDAALRRDRAVLWLGALGPLIYAPPQTVATAASISAIDVVRGGVPILCFAWALVSPRLQAYRIARGPAETALFGFGAVALLSFLWTDYSPRSAALKAVLLVFMYLCVAKVVATYRDFATTVNAVLHVTHIVLLMTLVQFLAVPSLVYTTAPGDNVPRLNSVVIAVSANILGVALGAGILGLLLGVGPRWAVTNRVRWPLAAIYVAMLLATRSRTIVTAIAVVFLISAIVAVCRSLIALAVGLTVLAAGAAALAYALNSLRIQLAIAFFFTRGQDTTGLTTLTGRTVIWTRAIQFWDRHTWLGAGYYTGHRFALPAFDPLFGGYSNIDSTWLESLVDVGLLGACLLGLFVVVGTWQLVRVDSDRYTKTLALSVWATVVVISIVNPTIQATFYTAVLAAALVFGSTRYQRRPAQRRRAATRARSRI